MSWIFRDCVRLDYYIYATSLLNRYNMTNNLFQLIHSHDAGLVVQRIMELYKDRIGTENQYLNMYRKLCTLESANSVRDFIQGMRILVHDIPPDEFNRVGYVCVSGVNGKSKRESWITNHSDLPLLHPEDSSWDNWSITRFRSALGMNGLFSL